MDINQTSEESNKRKLDNQKEKNPAKMQKLSSKFENKLKLLENSPFVVWSELSSKRRIFKTSSPGNNTNNNESVLLLYVMFNVKNKITIGGCTLDPKIYMTPNASPWLSHINNDVLIFIKTIMLSSQIQTMVTLKCNIYLTHYNVGSKTYNIELFVKPIGFVNCVSDNNISKMYVKLGMSKIKMKGLKICEAKFPIEKIRPTLNHNLVTEVKQIIKFINKIFLVHGQRILTNLEQIYIFNEGFASGGIDHLINWITPVLDTISIPFIQKLWFNGLIQIRPPVLTELKDNIGYIWFECCSKYKTQMWYISIIKKDGNKHQTPCISNYFDLQFGMLLSNFDQIEKINVHPQLSNKLGNIFFPETQSILTSNLLIQNKSNVDVPTILNF